MSRTLVWRSFLGITASIAIAFLVMMVMVILDKEFEPRVPWYGTAAPLWFGIGAGLLILIRQFRWYALPMGVVYVVLMVKLLTHVGLILVGNIYGDWL